MPKCEGRRETIIPAPDKLTNPNETCASGSPERRSNIGRLVSDYHEGEAENVSTLEGIVTKSRGAVKSPINSHFSNGKGSTWPTYANIMSEREGALKSKSFCRIKRSRAWGSEGKENMLLDYIIVYSSKESDIFAATFNADVWSLFCF